MILNKNIIITSFILLMLYIVINNINKELILSLDFSVIVEYRVVLFDGLLLTLFISIISTLLGTLFGIILAILTQSKNILLIIIINIFVEIFRNTPLLVQLIWIHFALPTLTGISTNALTSGIITIVLQASAYFTEIARAGIEAIPKGQFEASYSLGLPKKIHWKIVILPQAIKIIIPSLVNFAISLFKATAILSILHISELMTVANRISNVTFKPIELFSAVALIYCIAGFIISKFSKKVEERFKTS